MRGRGYQNAVLTVIAALLAVNVVDRQWGVLAPSAAEAQVAGSQEPGGMSNALEQRKQMIAELRQLTSRLERLDARLTSGISVKVTDMPPLRLPPERGAQGRAADRPVTEASVDTETGK
jgi:hypothetical protein